MRITDLTLPVSDVDVVAAWFKQVLDLDVQDRTLVAGWSRIHLVAAQGRPLGGVHLAFNVPDNRFDAAQTWLRDRCVLQQDRDGKSYFALESNWKSQSIYFTGPDGLILELIGRQRLPHSTRSGPFHGSEITCLSEVGLPSHDVPTCQQNATDQFGSSPLSEPSAHFAPMGDDEGLLILVDASRTWFPEQRDLPNGEGLQVVIADVVAGGVMAEAGWRVRSQAQME